MSKVINLNPKPNLNITDLINASYTVKIELFASYLNLFAKLLFANSFSQFNAFLKSGATHTVNSYVKYINNQRIITEMAFNLFIR